MNRFQCFHLRGSKSRNGNKQVQLQMLISVLGADLGSVSAHHRRRRRGGKLSAPPPAAAIPLHLRSNSHHLPEQTPDDPRLHLASPRKRFPLNSLCISSTNEIHG